MKTSHGYQALSHAKRGHAYIFSNLREQLLIELLKLLCMNAALALWRCFSSYPILEVQLLNVFQKMCIFVLKYCMSPKMDLEQDTAHASALSISLWFTQAFRTPQCPSPQRRVTSHWPNPLHSSVKIGCQGAHVNGHTQNQSHTLKVTVRWLQMLFMQTEKKI